MLTLDQFKDRTTMPATFVDELENVRPGWVAAQIVSETAWLYARLGKRYNVPFAEPVPEMALRWLTALVTKRCWLKRGFDPQEADMVEVQEDLKLALDEIKEAADSEVGLFELPLRADTNESGVSRGGTRVYSEQSPYVWVTKQARIGRDEDRSGDGSRS